MNKNGLNDIVKGLSVIVLYFTFSLFGNLPFALLQIDYNNLPNIIKEIYQVSIQIIMIAIFIIIFNDYLKNALNDIKKNHYTYFKKYLKFYILGVIIMVSCNALITFLGGGVSDNESAIRNEFALYPIYTFICGVIFAPIVEEIVFRLGFRKIISNNVIFILFSGLFFGALHLINMFDNQLILLYLGAYSSLGFMFAYMLAKTNNIFVTIGFHFMHNGILMSIQFLALLIS